MRLGLDDKNIFQVKYPCVFFQCSGNFLNFRAKTGLKHRRQTRWDFTWKIFLSSRPSHIFPSKQSCSRRAAIPVCVKVHAQTLRVFYTWGCAPKWRLRCVQNSTHRHSMLCTRLISTWEKYTKCTQKYAKSTHRKNKKYTKSTSRWCVLFQCKIHIDEYIFWVLFILLHFRSRIFRNLGRAGENSRNPMSVR